VTLIGATSHYVTVLSRAVRWHLNHRILFYGNMTVVFD